MSLIWYFFQAYAFLQNAGQDLVNPTSSPQHSSSRSHKSSDFHQQCSSSTDEGCETDMEDQERGNQANNNHHSSGCHQQGHHGHGKDFIKSAVELLFKLLVLIAL